MRWTTSCASIWCLVCWRTPVWSKVLQHLLAGVVIFFTCLLTKTYGSKKIRASRENNLTIGGGKTMGVEPLCEVDSSSGDIYTMNISHQTAFPTILVGFLYASSRYDTWCKYFASNRLLKNISEYVSFLRFLAYPASTLTIHPRYKLYDHRTTTHTAVIQDTKYTTTAVTIM